MRKLAVCGVVSLMVSACGPGDENTPSPDASVPVPTTAMRANLKDAVLIGLVAGDVDTGQQASRKDRDGVLKDGGELPLCEYLTVAELLEVDNLGAYVYLCENPDPLSFCQDIPPEKLDTGRVDCTVRPWTAGDLLAVDSGGDVFNVLPTLPSWNWVTRVQQSEEALLVTLALPVKLTLIDETTDYCHVLYYLVDTASDSIVPYCYEYEYQRTFCLGPNQQDGWPNPDFLYVPEDGEEREYREFYQANPNGSAFCMEPMGVIGDWYFLRGTIHLTPHALYEPYWLENEMINGDFTRIVAGDQEGMYPMGIDAYTRNGIISGMEYYTFDASHVSISGPMSGVPVGWNGDLATKWVFESGARIVNGFPPESPGIYMSSVGMRDSTSVEFTFFDTDTLADESVIIDLSPHPLSGNTGVMWGWWNFMAYLGDYLFLQEYQEYGNTEARFYRVDLRSPHPIIEQVYQSSSSYAATCDRSVVRNGWAVNYSTRAQTDQNKPFVAYLMRPDGQLLEINAAMLGFTPQNIVLEDDQIVVTGMSGLTPRRFVINPLATEGGELLVETPTETIQMKTLIPLQ